MPRYHVSGHGNTVSLRVTRVSNGARVDNLAEAILADIQEYIQAFKEAFAEIFIKEAPEYLRRRAPRKTGRLRRSIRAGRYTGGVYIEMEFYGRFTEVYNLLSEMVATQMPRWLDRAAAIARNQT